MQLSNDFILLFVLDSGCLGRLTSGHIQRDCEGCLRIFDQFGDLKEYISGEKLRSWAVQDANGRLWGDWSSILPADGPLFSKV